MVGGVAFSESPVNEKKTPENAVEDSPAKIAPESTLGEFTWRGKLVDQACKEKHIDQICPVSPATARFGLVIDGGIIVPLDEAGNEKAKELVGKDGGKGNLKVSLVGVRQGGTFQVQSIKNDR
jgi:hypothetical protein